MDPLDAFYQQLDAEALLDRHNKELLADARETLAGARQARVAGFILTADSRDNASFRDLILKMSGQALPAEKLMVGVVPRAWLESVLSERADAALWREESWQEQRVFPIVVSTRDGFRFGFFPLGERGHDGIA